MKMILEAMTSNSSYIQNENVNNMKHGKHRDSLEIIEDCGAAEDLEDEVTTP